MTGQLPILGVTACLWMAAAVGPAAPQKPRSEPADPRIEEAVELRRRIDVLSRELERLLASLTDEQRQEVERRSGPGQASDRSDDGETGTEPEAGVEPAPQTPPVQPAEPPRAESVVPPGSPQPRASRCGTLDVLDSNGDGVISGADRHWRYLALWRDDGDGQVESAELRSLFRHGIRRVSARLYSYTTAKGAEGGVWLEEAIYFDLPDRRGRATLAVNAGGLARGGELWLEDGSGAPLEGFQALRVGLAWVAADGSRTPVLCPPR